MLSGVPRPFSSECLRKGAGIRRRATGAAERARRPGRERNEEGAGGLFLFYGKSPRVILSFLDAYGFSGKTVIPFVTSASTGISNVHSELPATYPDIKWKEGMRLNGMSDDQLKSWLKGLGL